MTPAHPCTGAYPFRRDRRGVWREIARFVRRDAPDVGTLVELGPEYCDFVNQFPERRRIALEIDPGMAGFASPEVDLRVADARELPGVDAGSVDLVFASNFLEHLDAADVSVLLRRVREALVPRGQLILIQPNHRICGARYFEDPTHRTVFDDRSIVDWLTRHGFSVSSVIPGLLPFSIKSRLPKWPLLVRLYLASPRRPGAAQMYVVAERS